MMDGLGDGSQEKSNCSSSKKRKNGCLRSISQDHSSRKRYRRTLRRKKSLNWDVPPVGFKNLSPFEYKEMLKHGQGLDSVTPSERQVLVPILSATLTRQARRLYIGNIPFCITEDEMIGFFNNQMHQLGISLTEGSPVVACQINWEKNFAFLEFRSIDETTQAMALNGIHFKNQILKIRRPQDYLPLPNCMESRNKKIIAIPGFISTIVPDTPYKIFIGGIPNFMTDDQLKDLLQSFGQLRGLNRIKDSMTGLYKGYAFCEYADTSLTNTVVPSLNGMKIADRKLTVQLANAVGNVTMDMMANENYSFVDATNNKSIREEATEVLCLLNMVTLEDLADDYEYSDIVSDIKEECENHGIVRSIEVPRPIENEMIQGCGRVYVEFNTVYDSQRAQQALAGRKFNGRIVVTSYYDPKKYHNRDFN